jgi:hypothetical protein
MGAHWRTGNPGKTPNLDGALSAWGAITAWKKVIFRRIENDPIESSSLFSVTVGIDS